VSGGNEACAQVLLDRAAGIADRPLTYRVPPALAHRAAVGVRALVPLGSRTATGLILSLGPCAAADDGGASRTPTEVRDLLDIPEPLPLFSPALLRLARRVAEETLSTLLDAVRCLVPPELLRRPPTAPRAERRIVRVQEYAARGVGRRQRAVLERLGAAPGGVPLGDLVRTGDGPAVRRLMRLGAVRVDAGAHGAAEPDRPPPTPGAHHGVGGIPRDPAGETVAPPPVLLWGAPEARVRWITDAVHRAVARGGQALVIAPAVELAEHMARALSGPHGPRVVAYHSALRASARREVWRRLLAQDADVVCGTRSALFAPLARVRLVVVDDEQDPSYKADRAPRYHARQVALERGALEPAQVVLGASAPSLEAYAAAAANTLRLVRLDPRGGPRIEIVDMRREHIRGRSGVLSPPLVGAVRRHLRAGGRVALFVNRVGYARVLVCGECGTIIRCRHCLVPVPFDRETGTVRCHLCGRVEAAPGVCPRCKGVALRWAGPGTKRVEEVVAKVFPEFRLARVDRETAAGFDRVAGEFAAGRLRLVVGTQLLLRGRRLRPSLVGVIDADAPLYRPDFRAAERAFQQLSAMTTLAGAEAVVQSRIPDHPVLRAIGAARPQPWYDEELRARREFGYPPYTHLARVTASAADAAAAASLAERAAAAARSAGVEVLGPAAAPPGAHRARVQCLLRAEARDVLRAAALSAARAGPRRRTGGRIIVEMDPEEID